MSSMLPRLVAVALCSIILGVSIPAGAIDNRAYEQYLLDIPSAQGALDSSAQLASESHFAGTPGDLHMAQWMRDQLQSDGFNASLEPFFADIPQQPSKVVLELLETPHVDFNVSEVPIAADPDGTRKNAGVLPFNAFSGTGNVVATLVDAGHGTDADYQSLYRAGISVSGRLVLVAYGAEFRGALARRAQANGAAGVLFWSNPADADGSDNGPAYPDGPYRPLGSVQRGTLGAPQLHIPTLPVTAITALRLQRSMKGRISEAQVHLRVDAAIKHQLLWNTVAVLPGKDPTHMVVLGAHRDAWVYGVSDNGAGISILLETARALGYIARSGWRPQYSIAIVGFDGEEIGELGSQAYVQTHFGTLEAGCLAYINEDENATGQTFEAMSAAALESILRDAAFRVNDPANPRQQLYGRWKSQPRHLRIEAPAGGSDFEAFLYDAGIPVMSAEFSGPFGVYHSSFDDLRYATTQADPGFVNHRALAQLVGVLAFRLTEGPLLYRFTPYVAHMRGALAEMVARGVREADISVLSAAVNRFAMRAADVDEHRMDAAVEIDMLHRLNRLYYGRAGYAPVAFPDLAKSVGGGDSIAIAAAAGRVAHDLDDISNHLQPVRR